MRPRFYIILFNLILLFSLSQLVAAQDRTSTYEISGRVVNEDGKPVEGAVVGLRMPEPTSPDAFHMTKTERDGRFRALDSSRVPADHATFWVSAPPADAYVPVDIMFGRLSYLDSSFRGQTVSFNGGHRVDLGDVRVQARYKVVSIDIRDGAGSPLSPEANDWNNLRVLVRDTRGDIVNEGGVSPEGWRKNRSSISLALPEGAWEIAVGVFGDSFTWTPLNKPVVITSESPGIIFAEVKLSDKACASATVAPSLIQEEARRELERRGLKYTEEEFIEKARMGNRDAVKLFLVAGMSTDARNKKGQTALMMASGPWPGQPDVLCVLLEAGADVNAKDFEGRTALVTSAGQVNGRIMEMLLKKGADVNAQTNGGWTALMTAARSGQANTVRLLLDAGADPALKNDEGKTALAVAFRHEGNEVVSLLEKAAAQSKGR